MQLWAFEIENADHLALEDHRDGEFRTSFRIHHEVARIGGDIGNENRFAQGGGCADDTFRGGDTQLSLNALAVLDVQPMAKDFLFLVVEHDADDLIVDNALDQFRGATKQLFHIKNGPDFPADLIYVDERFFLALLSLYVA